jgi:hypothetical protein
VIESDRECIEQGVIGGVIEEIEKGEEGVVVWWCGGVVVWC